MKKVALSNRAEAVRILETAEEKKVMFTDKFPFVCIMHGIDGLAEQVQVEGIKIGTDGKLWLAKKPENRVLLFPDFPNWFREEDCLYSTENNAYVRLMEWYDQTQELIRNQQEDSLRKAAELKRELIKKIETAIGKRVFIPDFTIQYLCVDGEVMNFPLKYLGTIQGEGNVAFYDEDDEDMVGLNCLSIDCLLNIWEAYLNNQWRFVP